MGERVFRGVLVGLFLLALGATLGARAGWVHFPVPRPDGPGFWQVSRALGFSAYAALTLEVVLGLFLSTDLARSWIARARVGPAHQWLSAVTLWLSGAHAAALLGDRYIRFDALDVLVPLLAPYRPGAVAAGIISLYSLLAIHASFALRSRIGPRAWRALHFLSFAAYLGATAHGLLAGTDGAAPWVRAMYTTSAGLVLWLAFYRALTALVPALRTSTLPGLLLRP